MTTTWRLKATRGRGWIERVNADGTCYVTAQAVGAHQWESRERAEAARARMRPGLVPVVALEGSAFDRQTHGAQN